MSAAIISFSLIISFPAVHLNSFHIHNIKKIRRSMFLLWQIANRQSQLNSWFTALNSQNGRLPVSTHVVDAPMCLMDGIRPKKIAKNPQKPPAKFLCDFRRLQFSPRWAFKTAWCDRPLITFLKRQVQRTLAASFWVPSTDAPRSDI